jgi:hypothetical protein
LCRARSVRGLAFRDNRVVEHTVAFAPFACQKAAFWFDGCREVTVARNVYADAYAGQTIWTQHMAESDLKVTDSRVFTRFPAPSRNECLPSRFLHHV